MRRPSPSLGPGWQLSLVPKTRVSADRVEGAGAVDGGEKSMEADVQRCEGVGGRPRSASRWGVGVVTRDVTAVTANVLAATHEAPSLACVLGMVSHPLGTPELLGRASSPTRGADNLHCCAAFEVAPPPPPWPSNTQRHLAGQHGQSVSRLCRVILEVLLECQSDFGG